MRAGQAAEVLSPELPDEPFTAKVTNHCRGDSATSRTLLNELQVDIPRARNSAAAVRLGALRQNHAHPPQLPASALTLSRERAASRVVKAQASCECAKSKSVRDSANAWKEISASDRRRIKVIATRFDSLVSGMTVPRRPARQRAVIGLSLESTVTFNGPWISFSTSRSPSAHTIHQIPARGGAFHLIERPAKIRDLAFARGSLGCSASGYGWRVWQDNTIARSMRAR